MHDVALEQRDPAQLLDEIARLRSEVARLEATVEELDRLAHRDPLVPLANRRGMLRELETMIARHERHDAPAAMLFVDLNDLKVFNDSFGHCGGDAALVMVAEKLVEGTRATDCVARLGGDEFCVLLDHADEKSALETAERLVDLIADEDCTVRRHADAAVGGDRRDADRKGRHAGHRPRPRRQGDVPGKAAA